jgi:hypothetical protein
MVLKPEEYHQVANNYQKKLRGNCQTLTEHNAANYGAKMQEILSLVPQGGSTLSSKLK